MSKSGQSVPGSSRLGARQQHDELAERLAAFSDPDSPIQAYVNDIRLMLSYCHNAGKSVSDEVCDYLSDPPDTGGQKRSAEDSDVDKLLKLHERLCAKIIPATPRSLASTNFWAKGALVDARAILTWSLFLFLILMALVGLRGYISDSMTLATAAAESRNVAQIQPEMDSGGPASDPNNVADPNTVADPNSVAEANTVADSNSVADPNTVTDPNSATDPNTAAEANSVTDRTMHAACTQRIYLHAAILGAALSGLFTMQRYLRMRTFDPNYLFVYVIRFTIGVVAGVLLANIGGKIWPSSDAIARLGPTGIALIGGYSAEAVRQILDRLVQVLTTGVEGRSAQSEKLSLAREMLTVADQTQGEPGRPEAIKKAVVEMIKTPEK